MSDYTLMFDVSWQNHDFYVNHTIAELLVAKKLTDCKLVSEGQTLHAHRLILAAASPFFLKMFLTPAEDLVEPVVCNFSTIAFKDLFNVCKFIYTGKVKLDHEDLTSFIRVGTLLEVKGIVGLNIDFDQGQEGLLRHPIVEEYLDEAMEEMKADDVAEDDVAEDKPLRKKKLQVVRAVKRKHSSVEEGERPVVPPKRSKRIRNYRNKENIDESQEYYADEDDEKMQCAFCQRVLNNVNTLKNHERFCTENPDRKISRCPICLAIVKPGSMTFHKRTQHGYVPKTRMRRAKTSMMKNASGKKAKGKPKPDNDALKVIPKFRGFHAKAGSPGQVSVIKEEESDDFESSFEDLI